MTGRGIDGAVAFSPDASILAASLGGELLILDGRAGSRIASQRLDLVALELAVRPDAQEVALLCANQLRVHTAPGWALRLTVALDGSPWSVAYATAPSRLLVASGARGLEVRDPRTGDLSFRVPGRVSD